MDDFRQVIDLDELTGDDTARLARIAAEAVRGLNWATRHDAGLGQPATAYEVIGALALAASRLPQLLTQITGWPGQALAAGRLGHDLGEDPAPDVSAAGIFPGDCRGYASAMAAGLDTAQQFLSAVNGNPRRKETP
ncbi:MAG TPA: hypothetical protein VMV92_45450 [Streptosporangiaceae bacterium]|nr:hypothetical protein [Streptosporangiaceae bacterium]